MEDSTAMKRCLFPISPVSFVQRLAIVLVVLVAMLSIGAAVTHASGGHAPIVIQSNSDFTSCACVVSGNGRTASPDIIGPWTIKKLNGHAAYIDGPRLNQSFEFLKPTIAGHTLITH